MVLRDNDLGPIQRRTRWRIDSRLKELIDLDQLRDGNPFHLTHGNVNHFRGIGAETKKKLAQIHGHTDGIDPRDFLEFLSGDEDVHIYWGEGKLDPDQHMGTLHTDGTLELQDRYKPQT